MSELKQAMNINEIMDLIPHRYPFLLIDKVTDEGLNFIEGYKNVSINEPFFQGHFPEDPIMPGVLICEAAAQLGAIMLKKQKAFENKLLLFAGLDGVRFKKPVMPGDRLDIRAEIIKIKSVIGKAKFECRVDNQLACSGEITFSGVTR